MSLVSVGMADYGLVLTLGMGGGGISPVQPTAVTVGNQVATHGGEIGNEYPPFLDTCPPEQPEINFTDLLKYDHLLNMKDERIAELCKELGMSQSKVEFFMNLLKQQQAQFQPIWPTTMPLNPDIFVPPMPQPVIEEPTITVEPESKPATATSAILGLISGIAKRKAKAVIFGQTEQKQSTPFSPVLKNVIKAIIVGILLALLVGFIYWCITTKRYALLIIALIGIGGATVAYLLMKK